MELKLTANKIKLINILAMINQNKYNTTFREQVRFKVSLRNT